MSQVFLGDALKVTAMKTNFLTKLQVDPFVAVYKNRLFEEGTTLAEVEKAYGFEPKQLQFFINDKPIKFKKYKKTTPVASDVVYARVLEGNIGAIGAAVFEGFKWLFTTGAGQKVIGSSAGGAAAPTMAAAGWFGSGLVPNWLGWQVINHGAMYLLYDLFNQNNDSGAAVGQTPTITSGSNSINKWGMVPVVLGQHYMVPPYAAPPYTEGDVYITRAGYYDSSRPSTIINPTVTTVRDEKTNFLRVLLCWGVGPVHLEHLRIGTSPLSSFNTSDYKIEHDLDGTKEVMELYPTQVRQDDINTELDTDYYIVETEGDTNEFSVTLTFPSGLFRTEEDSITPKGFRMGIEGRYRQKTDDDSGTWLPLFDEDVVRQTPQVFFLTRTQSNLTPAVYEVGVRRKQIAAYNNPALGGDARFFNDRCDWLNIKSYNSQKPVFAPGVAKTAIRFQASDDFSGALEQINALVGVRIPTWDTQRSSWTTTLGVSYNPAAIYRYVMTGAANPNPLPLDQVDNQELGAWYEYCASNNLRYSKIVNSSQSTFDLMGEVAAAGLARPHLSESGKWSVVIDQPVATSTMLITPRNSWGFQGNVVTDRLPHALRVQFVNRLKDPWVGDEVVVYADGYSDTPTGTEKRATYFETLQIPGVVDAAQAQLMGQRGIKVLWQRREGFSVTMDFEQLSAEKGDKVLFQYDLALIGQTSARIKTLTDDGAVKRVTCDEFLTFEARKIYFIDVRLKNGSIKRVRVNATVGSTKNFSIATGDASGIEVGNLFSFGESNSATIECLVNSIEPQDDLTAVVSLVPYAEEIYTSDPLPPYNPNITDPVALTITGPLPPRIVEIVSDERALPKDAHGITLPSMRIYIEGGVKQNTNPNNTKPEFYQVRWRASDGENYQYLTIPITQEFAQINGLIAQTEYQVGVRTLDRERGYSAWTTQLHIVAGLGLPPNPVTEFDVASIGDQAYLRWQYNEPSPDAVSYTIRYSADVNKSIWNEMLAIATAIPIREKQFSIPNQNGTYAIKVIDASGAESVNALYANATLLNPRNEVVVNTLTEAPNFTGTLSGMVKSAGNIKLQIVNNNIPMSEWPVLSELRSLGGSNYTNAGTYTTTIIDITGIADVRLKADINIVGGENADDSVALWRDLAQIESLASAIDASWAVSPQYRTRNTTSANWSKWINFSTTDVTGRYFQFRVSVNAPLSGNSTPLINRVTFTASLITHTETGGNYTIPSSGGLINFTNSFIQVPSVTVTMQNPSAGDYYVVTNKTNTGFTVRAYNSSGNAISNKIIDWSATGV